MAGVLEDLLLLLLLPLLEAEPDWEREARAELEGLLLPEAAEEESALAEALPLGLC